MNILFLTMGGFDNIEAHSIYTDLLRCFRNHGHKIYAITPNEKRFGKDTELIYQNGAQILHIKTGDVMGANNLVSKGIAQISIEPIYIKAIKHYFSDIKFDLVIYSTPPITFSKVVEYVKQRDGASSYLLLKDIFPQNAVDLGMMSKKGLKSIIYKYFRNKEKQLYTISDYIGCMSKANVNYVVQHNPDVDTNKIEVCPNVIEIRDKSIDDSKKKAIRDKYGIPEDKKAFVYGGNLGRPQGIDFIIKCLKSQKNNQDAFFIIVGDGTEYGKLEEYYKQSNQSNFKLMKRLPKEDYDTVVAACDVGLIFLDHRFTIPNFPSRLLGYIQAKLPVLACTDPNTDVGKVITEGNFGWWCESNNVEHFDGLIFKAIQAETRALGEIGFQYLQDNYTVERGYTIIQNRLK